MAIFALTDSASLKAALDIPSAVVKNDTYLGTLITSVSGEIARLLNRDGFVKQDAYTEERDVAPGQRRFWLRGRPLVSVTSVKYDPSSGFGSGTVLDVSTYSLEKRRGRLELDYDLVPGGASKGWAQALQVVYTGGIADTLANLRTVAPELEEATWQTIAAMFRRQGGSPLQSSVSGQGGSVTFPDVRIPEGALKKIMRWRVPNAA